MHAASADGRSLFTAISPRRAASGLNYGKSPAYLSSFANPDEHRIVVIDADTGAMETIHSERARIEHVNAAPGDPDLLTFCHEGPWARVRQRIWGLRVSTGEVWPIRPQNGDLAVGHEYFVRGAAEARSGRADGASASGAFGAHWIGYHGRRLPEERVHTFGFVRSDNSECIEWDFPYHCTHFTSYGLNWALGDGTPANVQPWFRTEQRPFLMLFRRRPHAADGTGATRGNAVDTVARASSGADEIRFDGPRVLAYHRSTFNEQLSHPHPQFTPDGEHVMFTSDVGGYANIYMVPVGSFEELPRVEDCRVEW
jgi:oligogalacturonide lyase